MAEHEMLNAIAKYHAEEKQVYEVEEWYFSSRRASKASKENVNAYCDKWNHYYASLLPTLDDRWKKISSEAMK